MIEKIRVRVEGPTLNVQSVELAVDYYVNKLGFKLEWDARPNFALVRIGSGGDTLGLLAWTEAEKEGAKVAAPEIKRAVPLELNADHLDAFCAQLKLRGITVHVPPHDEAGVRTMTAFDPDGYPVEFSQNRSRN